MIRETTLAEADLEVRYRGEEIDPDTAVSLVVQGLSDEPIALYLSLPTEEKVYGRLTLLTGTN